MVDLLTEKVNKTETSNDKPGGKATDKILLERNVRVVSIEDVEKIKEAEIANAADDHPWEKFTRIKDMLTVLDE